MILPERVFGRASVKRMSAGLAMAPISLATCDRRVPVRGLSGLGSSRGSDESHDGGPGDFVRSPDDGGLGDVFVRDERALHLHGSDAVARDVHLVVDSPHHPEIPLAVAVGAIPGEVGVSYWLQYCSR